MLRASRTRYVLLALASLVFVALGVVIFVDAGGFARVAGAAIVVLFVACGAIGVLQLLFGSLRLSPEGFTVDGLGRQVTRRWSDVESFSVIRAPSRNEIVGIRFAPAGAESRVRAAIRSTAGFEGALPDTYGMKAADLAELMNTWRRRYSATS